MRNDQQARRRRGGRRHGSRGPRNENRNENRTASRNRKPGFFARLIAFFTGGGKNKPQKPAERRERAERPVSSEPKPARSPELAEVTTPKVYVGNLSFDALESDLFELFAGVGSVQNAEIVSHRETQKSKGFGFVTMATVDEAKRAVTELHDKEFMGRRLVISGAKTNDAR